MTAHAVLKSQITAKGSFAVMTSRAIHPAYRKMFTRMWRTHLPRLRRPGRQPVAINAIKPLATPMIGMTEGKTESAGISRRAVVRFLIVAYAAGSDLAASRGFATRRMAAVTTAMSIESHRY